MTNKCLKNFKKFVLRILTTNPPQLRRPSKSKLLIEILVEITSEKYFLFVSDLSKEMHFKLLDLLDYPEYSYYRI